MEQLLKKTNDAYDKISKDYNDDDSNDDDTFDRLYKKPESKVEYRYRQPTQAAQSQNSNKNDDVERNPKYIYRAGE